MQVELCKLIKRASFIHQPTPSLTLQFHFFPCDFLNFSVWVVPAGLARNRWVCDSYSTYIPENAGNFLSDCALVRTWLVWKLVLCAKILKIFLSIVMTVFSQRFLFLLWAKQLNLLLFRPGATKSGWPYGVMNVLSLLACRTQGGGGPAWHYTVTWWMAGSARPLRWRSVLFWWSFTTVFVLLTGRDDDGWNAAADAAAAGNDGSSTGNDDAATATAAAAANEHVQHGIHAAACTDGTGMFFLSLSVFLVFSNCVCGGSLALALNSSFSPYCWNAFPVW